MSFVILLQSLSRPSGKKVPKADEVSQLLHYNNIHLLFTPPTALLLEEKVPKADEVSQLLHYNNIHFALHPPTALLL